VQFQTRAQKGQSADFGENMNHNHIAIIGMSGRYPDGANTPAKLWDTLRSGKDAVTEAKGDRWDDGWHHPDANRPGRVYTKAGGFLDRIDGFDAEFFGLSPREARQVDPQQRLLLELAWEAHEDAGIAPRSRAGSHTGVFVGISSNDYASLVGPEWPDAYSNTGSSFSIAANRISYFFDFHGPSVAVDTACSSSLVCIHQACQALLSGECSTALAGAVSILMHIRPWLGFAKASMLSPNGRCKSFDASGDGYVRSEGGGLVLLKRLGDAERDGDRILGVILGTGVNSDGRTMGLSMPNGEAQEALLRTVYGQAGVKPEDVFYVEAHGTGTAVGDPIECGALGRFIGAPRPDGSKCLIGSVKSNIGHLEAASGIAGLTKVLLALKHREIPANLHFNTPNPKIDFENWKLQVVTEPTQLPTGRTAIIGINSFGFGGTNAHMIVSEYQATVQNPAPDASGVLVLSAQSDTALKAVAREYAELLRRQDSGSWLDLCAAAATTRTMLRNRIAVLASNKIEAAEKLEAYLAEQSAAGIAAGSSASAVNPIAFVYSGNGPQWWGMGRELLATNAIFRAEIEAIDAIFAPLAGWSLIDEMARPESESRIAMTEVAQPLLFAQQMGITRVMEAAGIRPSAALGHSVGEAAAACASGALTREQATQVIFHRSMEQAKTAGMGKMAAIGAGPEEVNAAIAGIDGWLELAAVNSPQSVTVAGDPAALEHLVQAMTAAGKFARVLALNYPFHTKAMDPIREGLLESLKALTPGEAKVPFISTVEGAEKSGTELDAGYWFRNVREPVRFHDAIANLLRDRGYVLFVEVGPHPVLKDYVLQSAKAAEISATALQTLRRPGSKGPEPEEANLATAIAACHANGGSDLAQMYTRTTNVELPFYPWQHARHWRGHCVLPDIPSPTQREHPLMGHRLVTGEGVWENVLDTNQLGYLKDHVVQGAVLFPAAGYIEIALAGAQSMLGKGVLDVENFEILRPLAIPAHGDPIVQLSADSKDGTFEIRSRNEVYSNDWTSHVRGRLSRSDSGQASTTCNLADIASRMVQSVSFDEHYRGASNRGLDYGPWFQGVGNVLLTAPSADVREALAEITLPALDDAKLAGYLAHPSLLDSCVQVLVTLIGQNEKRNCCTIPVQIGRVRSVAPLTSRMFCQVTMRRESERSAVADFHIMDAAGKLLMTIEEARCQKVDFNQSSATPLISEWLRPDTTAAPLAALPALPEPSTVAAAVQAICVDAERDTFYREILPEFDRLAGAYAAQALASMHPGSEPFDVSRLSRNSGVKREHSGLLNKMLRMAEEDGQLIKGKGTWTWNPERKIQDPDQIWNRLFAAYPRYQAELLLLSQVGGSLAAKLRGEETGDPTALLDQVQDSSPFGVVYNRIARAVVEKLAAMWPADRPVRILELGGTGGGLAAWILPVLYAEQTDYVFTDASEKAVARAEHRFAAHDFVRFEVLDPSRDLIEQGQPAGYFDLVIGSNVLGMSSSDLVSQMQAVMAPGGQILLVQANASRFTDLVFTHRSAAWAQELESAGYEDVVTLNDNAKPQQIVLLARRPMVDAAKAPVQDHAPRRWMLVMEEQGTEFAETLKDSLTSQNQSVSVHVFEGEEEERKATIAAVLAANPADEIVYVSSMMHDEAVSLLATQTSRCLTAIQLVQGLEGARLETERATPCHLTFVTRGALPRANGIGPLDPGQSSLWGLGRVIGNEHPSLDIRMIDLHSRKDGAEAASWLAAELLRRDEETEVQLAAGFRYVNRQRMNTMTTLARTAGVPETCYALDFQPQGGLDSLHLRVAKRRDPAPHEVEIAVKAAGLNFRDVLWAMGMLPEEAVEQGFSGPTIGMECAGEIVRVGSAVTSMTPGDRVVAFASSCFGSHVTTDGGSVAKMPDTLDFASAATIPTAFLTAYYAFDHLARLEEGETVLIHGAAGGVGIAAIQIAKLKGAKVIGTAGSARKRRMLEMMGVDHVLNSRSLEFADEVMRLTDGVGVDVVLNSLAGEAITKSLQCLRPFGRFLEIGKRDLYANTRIGLRPFRQNLSYFGIDADTLLIERAPLARKMFRAVMKHFAAGELQPLPFQEVPVSRAAEAFRAMQQSKHVGKLVVTMTADKPEMLPVVRSTGAVRAGVTYLVTGGLGGFGLSSAEWLASQGATSLALLSRRGAVTEEAIAGIGRLQAMGVAVKAFACDIANTESLSSVLASIRSEMAPLGGIIHSAAVIEDAPVLNLTAAQLQRVFEPKMIGAWNLHQATLVDQIEMFLLYSSSAAAVGNPGQGAYVAANLYLDSLALYRRSLGLPALSIGWGAIKDAGFLTRHQAVAGMLRSRTGLDATPANEALADLGRLSAVGASRVSVGRFDLQRLAQMLPGARVPRFMPIVPKGAAASLQAEDTLATVLARTPEAERRALVIARVREHGARVLGTSSSQINIEQPLAELGLDSLMAVELAGGLERDLGQPVSVMQLLSAGSLAAIAELVMKMLKVEQAVGA
jgi:phthiocerol/phenolphthiocerol synthesis type-I polyketide synthase C